MEKTLREELEDAFDIARIEGMLHSKDGKHSLSSEADAEGIIEFIYQRIKAKALTDEQIKSIKKQAFEEWSESPEYSQAWSGGEFSFRQLRDQIYDRAIAAAQLQAVLGELE